MLTVTKEYCEVVPLCVVNNEWGSMAQKYQLYYALVTQEIPVRRINEMVLVPQ